jgi:hypothetical protein
MANTLANILTNDNQKKSNINPLIIQDISDGDIIDFIDDNSDIITDDIDTENIIEPEIEDNDDSHSNGGSDSNISDQDDSSPVETKDNQIKDLGVNGEGGLLYSLLHMLDDLYVYGRTVIENNYLNLSNNADFNLVYPNIYIGNYSTSTNLELLEGLGVTHILSVIPTFNPPFPDKFTYLHIAAYDDESQNLGNHFDCAVAFIKNVLEQKNKKMLIHCMVGRSRSVSMFIAFLISILQNKFDQSIVDTSMGNDVSNEIEFMKLNRNFKLQNTNKNRVVDTIAVKYYNKNQDENLQINNNNDNENENNEISRIEYIKPQFNSQSLNKYKNFILYKKQIMLEELETIKNNYGNKNDKNDLIYELLLNYVRKYRTIACPNPYFQKQLITLLS